MFLPLSSWYRLLPKACVFFWAPHPLFSAFPELRSGSLSYSPEHPSRKCGFFPSWTFGCTFLSFFSLPALVSRLTFAFVLNWLSRKCPFFSTAAASPLPVLSQAFRFCRPRYYEPFMLIFLLRSYEKPLRETPFGAIPFSAWKISSRSQFTNTRQIDLEGYPPPPLAFLSTRISARFVPYPSSSPD